VSARKLQLKAVLDAISQYASHIWTRSSGSAKQEPRNLAGKGMMSLNRTLSSNRRFVEEMLGVRLEAGFEILTEHEVVVHIRR
jgi:hypothetical protein